MNCFLTSQHIVELRWWCTEHDSSIYGTAHAGMAFEHHLKSTGTLMPLSLFQTLTCYFHIAISTFFEILLCPPPIPGPSRQKGYPADSPPSKDGANLGTASTLQEPASKPLLSEINSIPKPTTMTAHRGRVAGDPKMATLERRRGILNKPRRRVRSMK